MTHKCERACYVVVSRPPGVTKLGVVRSHKVVATNVAKQLCRDALGDEPRSVVSVHVEMAVLAASHACDLGKALARLWDQMERVTLDVVIRKLNRLVCPRRLPGETRAAPIPLPVSCATCNDLLVGVGRRVTN